MVGTTLEPGTIYVQTVLTSRLRITAVGHRITGNPRDHVLGADYESLFVAVDDHSRLAYTQMQPTERKECAIAFL